VYSTHLSEQWNPSQQMSRNQRSDYVVYVYVTSGCMCCDYLNRLSKRATCILRTSSDSKCFAAHSIWKPFNGIVTESYYSVWETADIHFLYDSANRFSRVLHLLYAVRYCPQSKISPDKLSTICTPSLKSYCSFILVSSPIQNSPICQAVINFRAYSMLTGDTG
jgi:hypothetical protein